MFLTALLVLLSFILCACTQSGVTGSNSRGEDSIYSAEYINRICRTQPRHALGLLDTAERRNLLSPADINGMRAMIYNDGLGMRNVAIIYVRKTYELPEVKNDTTLLIKTLRMLAALNYTVSQYSELLKYATEGLDIAGKRGDLAAQAYFMQFVGFGKVKTESLDAGLEYIDRGNNIFSDIAHKKASWKEADDMLYGYMLQRLGVLYARSDLQQKGSSVLDTVRKKAFDGDFFVDNAVCGSDGIAVNTGNRTETCQYYAFFTGTATPQTYPTLWKRITVEFGPERVKKGNYPEICPSNAFIGNYLRMILLVRHGCCRQMLEESVDYFYYMAQRTGTLWEYAADFASCNHGFASYLAYLIRVSEESLKKEA